MSFTEKSSFNSSTPVDTPFEELHENDQNIFDELKSYAQNRIALFKIELVEKSSELVSKLVSLLLSVFCGLLTLIFLSVALAVYLGVLLNSNFLGFFIVAGVYLLLAVLVLLLRKNMIEKKLVNLQIKRFFHK